MSALDEAKAGVEHAKDQVASKFTKNKAEAADKVRMPLGRCALPSNQVQSRQAAYHGKWLICTRQAQCCRLAVRSAASKAPSGAS